MNNIKPYNASTEKKEQVEQMFDTISGEYDQLNRVISFGLDISWRKKIVHMGAEGNPDKILDLATGTADLAIALSTIGQQDIVALDLSSNMIEIAKKKVWKKDLENRIQLVVGDAENLAFVDESFDLVTIAFGVRNYQNLQRGLSEIHRVLKKGGRLLVLETSVPTHWVYRMGYYLYSILLLPIIGFFFSKDKKAYAYLSKSAINFPYGEKFNKLLKNTTFEKVKNYPQSMGVATIYSCYK